MILIDSPYDPGENETLFVKIGARVFKLTVKWGDFGCFFVCFPS